jgi:hypothetical protein
MGDYENSLQIAFLTVDLFSTTFILNSPDFHDKQSLLKPLLA